MMEDYALRRVRTTFPSTPTPPTSPIASAAGRGAFAPPPGPMSIARQDHLRRVHLVRPPRGRERATLRVHARDVIRQVRRLDSDLPRHRWIEVVEQHLEDVHRTGRREGDDRLARRQRGRRLAVVEPRIIAVDVVDPAGRVVVHVRPTV